MNSGKKIHETNEQKINEDIKMLTENLLQAYSDCMSITCPEERQSTIMILQHLKEDFEGYFSTYVDKREGNRDAPVFVDMVRHYGITLAPGLLEILT